MMLFYFSGKDSIHYPLTDPISGARRKEESFLKKRADKHTTIRTKITLLAFAIFFVSLVIVGLVIETTVLAPFETSMSENAMDIALSVASIPAIQENVGKTGGHRIIDPIADGIRKKTGAEYVVVFDNESIRYSHPVKERIGRKFVGGDEGDVLKGKAYISKAVGTLGPSMRAFVPVFRDGVQVGAVSVGVLLDDIRALRRELSQRLIFALFLGLFVGLIGAQILAWNIKKANRGLEPYEIVRILKEREGVLDSIPEGVLAVDERGNISLINNTARKLLGIEGKEVLGKPAEEHIPNTRLPEVVRTGEAELDQEQILMNSRILTNRIPLVEKGRTIGALASFRDMSVVQNMAEELTGVKKYLEALRVRNHEFLNKLQTISGLIQLGDYSRAVEYISGVVDAHQTVMTLVTKRFRNPSVGGLLLGKMGRCRELGIDLNVDPDSYLAETGSVSANALVVIIGNLLENAVESVLKVPRDRRTIDFSLFDESDRIILSVRDTGQGIPAAMVDRIFEKGFTTKSGEKRGYGLFSVKSLVESYGGEINVVSEEGQFTEMVVNLPNGGME
jgi:PAS domain S-box-containing protein